MGISGRPLTSQLARFAAAAAEAVRTAGSPRIVWRTDSRVHIAVRGVSHDRWAGLARAVEAGLERHPAVDWAAVNAPLGTVVVACRGDVPAAELIAIVERTERDYAGDPEPPPSRPTVIDRVPGAVGALAAGVAGLAGAGAGRVLRTPRLPAELGALVQFIDTQPRLRAAVERAVGPDRADLLLAASNAVAQSAARGLGGLALDVALRAAQLAEAVLERDAWAQAEAVLCADHRSAGAPPVTPERPQPLPAGPADRYSEFAGLSAAGGFAATLAVSSPRRAAGVALAALPKAARLGREGFAAVLGCLLAHHGVVITDHRALRRLDRIDTIVVDADVLTTGDLVVGEVIPVSAGDASELSAVVHALFDPDRAGQSHTDGAFTLGPLDALGMRQRTGTRIAARLTARGATHVLGLAHGRVLAAIVAVVPERAAAADMVLAAAARTGVQVAMAGQAPAFPAMAALPGGRRLVASVRSLQADGAVVLLVSRQRRALAAADLGIGVAGRDGRPAWGAHLLIDGDLASAAVALDAVRPAREASCRGVRLSAASLAAGSALALAGPATGASRRSLLAVNGAGAIALASAAWSAAGLARRPPTTPPPSRPWHAMPADLVLARLRTQPDGLTEADASSRRTPGHQQRAEPSRARAFVEEAANPLTPVLLGGAALSASIGAVADALIVSGVWALSALIGGAQRVYTDLAVARLLRAAAVTARVRRDGAERPIPATELVPGDVVLLGTGDVVPADCRLLAADALQADESSLTGESAPVDKTIDPVAADAIPDRRSMLYEGTTIAAGQATAVVVATRPDTEMGRSLAALAADPPVTGVEARLAQITRTTLPLALGSAVAVVGAGLLRGHRARDTIGAAVGLAVASVPEGLPFLVTGAQLASARRLGSRGALVRNPRTIEALGRVNVLCFDKTGTLTAGRMAVSAVSDGARVRRIGALGSSHRQVLAAALRATPRSRRDRSAEHMTDAAVSDAAAGEQLTRSDGHRGWHRTDARPFEPSRGYHATLAGSRDGALLSVKGAPELILPRCKTWRGRAIGPRDRNRLSAQLDQLTSQGYRVLAVTENHVSADYQLNGDLGQLCFSGFVAFGDPVRATAGASVRELREAGVHIMMITGDHPATAAAIATELDVLNGGTVVTGSDLDRLADAALPEALANATVIARCTPEHKVRVVRALQSAGRVVAMTGDGANDAAAIRLADVGIALAKRGTPAASAAADLVVGDDRLETIISAIVEGRAMWRSVREAIGILVGGNIGEIGYTLFGTALTGSSPLNARQLLLVNLLTDLVPALTIAMRTPPEETAGDLLAEGPDASLGSALTQEIAVRAAATGAAASGAWLVARLTGRAGRARTVGLAAVIGTQIGQTLLVGGRSPAVVIACLASLGILVAVVQTPGVSQFFGCTPIGPVGWTIAAGSASAATGVSILLPRLRKAVTPALRDLGSRPGPAEPRPAAHDVAPDIWAVAGIDR